MLFAAAGIDEVEVALGGGVDQDVVGVFADAGRAKVVAGAAELVDEVVEDGSGGAAGGMEVGAAEAIERVHVEMVLEEGGGVLGEEGVAFVDHAVGECSELGGLVIGDEELGGGNAGDLVGELAVVRELGDGELTGGVIDTGEAGGFPVAEDGGEVVRALVVEQLEIVDGAGGEDAGDLALDEFPGCGIGRLLGDGDAFPGLEQAGDVALGGVVGNAAHGGAAALGEGDVHDGRGGFGVLEEHLVEVAEPVEEDHVRRQGFPHGLVLGHHRSQGGSGHGRESGDGTAGNQEVRWIE